MSMRTISENFEKFLMSEKLKPLMDKIKGDSTLDFEIRKDRCEIYYRGAELFSLEEKNKNFYFTKQSNQYIKADDELVTADSISKYVSNEISKRKDILDCIKKNGPKGMELDTEQRIVQENNLTDASIKTDYYIVDMEYSDSASNLRFDMLAIKSIQNGNDRRTPAKRFAIIELKYGINAVYSGDKEENRASLKEHFKDLNNFITNSDWFDTLREQIKESFNMKLALGFINRPENNTSIKKIEDDSLMDKPEYIIILANYNVNELRQKPKDLINELTSIKNSYTKVFDTFDVKIATSAFMGYGLYSEYMKPFDEFVVELEK